MLSTFLTCLLFSCTLGTLTLSLQIIRPRSVSGALPLAFCVFIGWLSILFNILSLWRGISPMSLLISHGLLLGGLWYWILTRHITKVLPQVSRWLILINRAVTSPAFYCLAPLVIIFYHIAFLVNAPNTYDSMTYHMARVAHWLQQGSVGYYPTSITRQNEMGPGAEYVIFFLQLLSGEDLLAALPQFLSYILAGLALYHILRLVGCPRSVLPFLLLLGLSTPMAVLQATTTQNDLVCSLTAVVVILASLRLLVGEVRRWQLVDTGLVGVLLAVAFLVKPIALLVSLPLLAVCAIWQIFRHLGSGIHCRWLLAHVGVLGLSILVVAGPDICRKILYAVSRPEVYPLFAEWTVDRLYNPLRLLGQNLPWPEKTGPLLNSLGFKGELLTRNVFVVHQDFIGNPVQMLLLLGLSLVTLVLGVWAIKDWRFFLPRLLLSLTPLLGWIAFALMVRNQPWVTRLQLPLFIIAPLSALFLVLLIHRVVVLRRTFHACILIISLFSLAYSGYAAVHNKTRSLDLAMFWGGRLQPKYDTYYANAQEKEQHDFLINLSRELGCRQIGLLLGGDNVEYPLTWRLMQHGREVRHVFMGRIDSWPCLLYVGRGGREHVPRQGEQWLPADEYHTFTRNLEWEFNRSDLNLVTIHAEQGLTGWQPVNNVHLNPTPMGLVLQAYDDDPQILLPPFILPEDAGWVIVKLEVVSARVSVVQFFYKTPSGQYSEQNSVTLAVAEGSNTLYVQLPAEVMAGGIRFDPGTDSNDRMLVTNFSARLMRKEAE